MPGKPPEGTKGIGGHIRWEEEDEDKGPILIAFLICVLAGAGLGVGGTLLVQWVLR